MSTGTSEGARASVNSGGHDPRTLATRGMEVAATAHSLHTLLPNATIFYLYGGVTPGIPQPRTTIVEFQKEMRKKKGVF